MGFSMIERGDTRTYSYGRLEVVADRTQVFPDDPGAGTPLVVTNCETGESATVFCALGTGEIEYSALRDSEVDFLCEVEEDTEDFLHG